MEDNKFFKFLWRANAIFIFALTAIGLFFAVTASFFAITEMRSDVSPPPIPSALNDIADDDKIEGLRLDVPHSPKTVGDYTYFELKMGKDSNGKSLSYSKSQIRNIIVYNLKTDETHWVFETTQQEIESYKPILKISYNEEGEKIKITRGFLIVKATSDADKSVNRELWVMSPDGKDLRRLLANVSKTPNLEYFDGQTKLIVETEKEITVYPINVDDLSIGAPVVVSVP
jgi:hypothetical protein